MKTKIGINGFGRIGRLVFRAGLDNPDDVEVRRHQRSLHEPLTTCAYMLQATTAVHGQFTGEVSYTEDGMLVVNGKRIPRLTALRWTPPTFPGASCGADYVVESTGRLLHHREGFCRSHRSRRQEGRHRLLPAKDKDTPTVRRAASTWRPVHQRHDLRLQRFLHHQLPGSHRQGSCNDNFGIVEGLMTTVHSTTATQKTVDGPSMKDWRGGRAAAGNIIPSSTGAAKAVRSGYPRAEGQADRYVHARSHPGCLRGGPDRQPGKAHHL